MKKVYILTIDYPFGNGEPFLRNELGYADSCTLVSTHIGTGSFDSAKLGSGDLSLIHPDSAFFKGKKSARLLSAAGALFTSLFWKELFSEDIKPINLKKVAQLLSTISKAKELARYMRPIIRKEGEAGHECVFYAYWMNQLALSATLMAKEVDGVAVTRCHGYDLYPRRENNEYVTFQRYLTKHLDRIYPISNDGYRTITELFPGDSEIQNKVAVSRLGTKEHGIGPAEKSEYFTVVSCSNVTGLKRVHLILQALTEISAFKVRWIHFGTGDKFEELKAQLAETQTEHLIELRGYTQNADIMKFYKENHVDVFVNVSESEGIPVSIMEVLSFGIPVIATDVGGVSEIVENGTNGYLIDPNCSKENVAEYIEQVHDLSEEAYTALRQSARASWEEKYSAEHNYSAFYNELKG